MVAKIRAAVDALPRELSFARGMITSDGLVISFSIFRAFHHKSTSLILPTSCQHWIQNGS